MQIKINEKILSIPPYISTTWSQITSIHMKGNLLIISLLDNETVSISGLQAEIIEKVFEYHVTHLEKASLSPSSSHLIQNNLETMSHLVEQLTTENDQPIRLAFGSLDGIGSAMQHNPSQANAPDLPTELLQKISAIAKIVTPTEDFTTKAEPFCNCFHCQIARAINTNEQSDVQEVLSAEEPEEKVNDEDLHFQQWSISQTGEHLFSVTNRLDNHEQYNVYLGEPVGCTCGRKGCEHILAVLKS